MGFAALSVGAKQREFIHGYWACVSFLDAQIGRILDTLDALGMANDTAVVFCSDHGWQLGEHKLWSKCSNYEEAVRVPLLVAAPGITTGEKTDALTELVDVYPAVEKGRLQYLGKLALHADRALSSDPL